MSEKFQGKYRIETTRLQYWNYGWNAMYFITICTKDRECFFGDVEDGEMKLNAIGRIVEIEWLKTFEMRPDMNLSMGEFVIMPNHFHGVIGIGDNIYNSGIPGRDAMHCVSTTDNISDAMHDGNGDGDAMHCVSTNQFGPQSKNLASIIRGFKIGVTKNARLINPDFAWQSRYHDHIIRNQKSFQRITQYIIDNPKIWIQDKFFK